MSNHFYNGTPIEEVDFEKEFKKEFDLLLDNILKIRESLRLSGKKFNYRFWTIKLSRANKALEVGQVTLDGGLNNEDKFGN